MKKLEIIAKELDKYFQEFSTEIYSCGYQQGLEDAWEYARKIAKEDIQMLKNLFGTVDISQIFLKYTVTEVMQKIKEYELIEQHYYEERQKCDTCYHNKTEFSVCQYCTDGDKYEEVSQEPTSPCDLCIFGSRYGDNKYCGYCGECPARAKGW